ncbi:unnamed protein product [Symbiodinium natans]|uniref:Uncharacterized protein n=1 Tax=Symbiodinium natans TaxID=878477 RepID=A0A812KFC2_9DINO|nr:unnamed protein product [Symbiodinium natans]
MFGYSGFCGGKAGQKIQINPAWWVQYELQNTTAARTALAPVSIFSVYCCPQRFLRLAITNFRFFRRGHVDGHAKVAVPSCPAPNVTTKSEEGETKEEKQEPLVQALVLDDPATDTEDDYWLHPCHCLPHAWGANPPAAGDTLAAIPSGSNNEFDPPPQMIVSSSDNIST